MENKDIVVAIKNELNDRNMTYKELSQLSGVPLDTLNNFFRGKTKNPRIDTIQAIEKVLGLNNSLYTADDYANGIQDTKKIGITADEEDILDKYQEVEELLGEKGKKLIIEFCDSLLNAFKK